MVFEMLNEIEQKFIKLQKLKDKVIERYLEIYENESVTDIELKTYLKEFLKEIEKEFKYRLENW